MHAHLHAVKIKLIHCEETHIHLVNQGTTAKVQYRCFNTSGVVRHDGQQFKIHSICGLQILYLWKIRYKKFLKLLTCHFFKVLNLTSFSSSRSSKKQFAIILDVSS